VAGGMPFGDPAGHVLDAFGAADGSAAVFMDYECHDALLFIHATPAHAADKALYFNLFFHFQHPLVWDSVKACKDCILYIPRKPEV
jgi:hypothetical protein